MLAYYQLSLFNCCLSLIKGITSDIRMLCFVPINGIPLTFCVLGSCFTALAFIFVSDVFASYYQRCCNYTVRLVIELGLKCLEHEDLSVL